MPPALGRALRPVAAGLCGSAAHTVLMTLKDWFGWLPAFRPYDGLQALLASVTGSAVPALVPWLLTYFNGAVVLGLIYGRIHRLLPGRSGVARGALFGIIVWCVMGLTFFPAIGMGCSRRAPRLASSRHCSRWRWCWFTASRSASHMRGWRPRRIDPRAPPPARKKARDDGTNVTMLSYPDRTGRLSLAPP